MTHIAMLVCDPARPALDEAWLAAPAQRHQAGRTEWLADSDRGGHFLRAVRRDEDATPTPRELCAGDLAISSFSRHETLIICD